MSMGPTGSIVPQDYTLVLDNKYSTPGVGNTPVHEFVGPSRWRIEEPPAEQWISVSAAIRYVTEIHDATRDASIREIRDNAEKTLALLSGSY